MRGVNGILIALTVPMSMLAIILWLLGRPHAPAAAPAQAAGHGCAIFGGSLPPPCESHPGWSSGTWQPPEGLIRLHVLAVGGGGGGGATNMRGDGGSGGNSGEAVVQDVTIAAGTGIAIQLGKPGQGGQHYMQGGGNGDTTRFGSIAAYGGEGAENNVAAVPDGTSPEGSSGGGGAGGGSAQRGFAAGSGGNGGMGGSAGQDGEPGGQFGNIIPGQQAWPGYSFPPLAFTFTQAAAGAGGAGGASIGQDGTGCGGGGGGGGGGVLLGGASASPTAASGPSPPAGTGTCGNDIGMSGAGGAGYGAGGGGGGNFAKSTAGGAGAPGVVYVEW